MIDYNLYIPWTVQKGQFNFFAIDNTDFSEDTPDGKRITHATAIAVFQEHCEGDTVTVMVPSDNSTKTYINHCQDHLLEYKMASNPKPASPTYDTFVVNEDENLLMGYKMNDTTWLISKF